MDPVSTYGVLSLRCGPYGAPMGCCGCGVGPMGIYGGAVAAVWDLWGWSMGLIYGAMSAYGDLQDLLIGLRCRTYGDLWGCCGCGVGLMGIYGVLWLR